MLKMVEMDENVTLAAQLEEQKDGRPVILINKFNVKPEEVDQLLKAWAADAAYLKQKPGFISTQLHRGMEEVVCLSIMLYGSLSNTLSKRLAILHLGRLLHVTQMVLSGRLIFLEKLLSLESVWTE
jgi:hypothetical protein